MPHVIRAQDIPMSERRPHLVAYLGQVRQALLDPSLPQRTRARLQERQERLRAEMQSVGPQ